MESLHHEAASIHCPDAQLAKELALEPLVEDDEAQLEVLLDKVQDIACLVEVRWTSTSRCSRKPAATSSLKSWGVGTCPRHS